MNLKTSNDNDLTLDDSNVEALRAQLCGPLLFPDDHDYEESRTIWNAMIDRHPAMIARCRGVNDVITCVNFARDTGIKFTIKGGGHNISGLAACDGGLMIDMSLMRGVWVDTEKRIAHAQAGCLLGDIDRETQLHGLAAVLGFVSNTGTAGLTLGGGFGYLTRKYGWTSDNLEAMDVVTAGGKLIRASKSENADLFWGLCGGGGNFGVAVGFDYRLYPVGPEIMGGGVAWRGEDAKEVLEMYRSFAESAPPECTAVAALRKAPPAPWLPKEVHGESIVGIFVCDTGAPEEAKKRADAIKSFGNPVGDVLQARPYVSQQSLLDATQPKGRRYYWKSEYLPKTEPDFIATAIKHAGQIKSPHSAILVFPLDGALNKLPENHSAVGNRKTGTVVNIAAAWDDAADDDVNITWARTAWEDMRAFSTGGTYLNFLTEEEGTDRLRDALGGNYDRLVEIKTKWDPQNLFRTNKNIPPKG